jgi:phenylalanyl-tRNA synthetase alpha chain
VEDLKQILSSARLRARRARKFDALAQLRSEFLGKKGVLGQAMRQLGKLPPEERPKQGAAINAIKVKIEESLSKAHKKLDDKLIEKEAAKGRVDVTMPGRRTVSGNMHPLRIVERDIVRSLSALGFTVADGPRIEHDWYNFEALNMPPEHPARDMQDTFFCAEDVVLRTHTSNVQIRIMTRQKPPVRMISHGMVFRNDEVDASHSPVFHQVEGLWIDNQANFSDLKGVLNRFVRDLFGSQVELRFRPSFFPFTEPSAEVDLTCVVCEGKGVGTTPESVCKVCRGTGWLEILGAGMVDPAVLESVGYDPDEVQGFAFGAGIERIAMLRWGIDDIRLFYENDLRFLSQFSGKL